MEHPTPAQVCGNWSADDRGQCCHRCENDVENGQADTSFVDIIQIADCSEGDGFVCCKRNSLYNTSCQKLIIRSGCFTNNCSDDSCYRGKYELRAFAPDTSKCTDKGPQNQNVKAKEYTLEQHTPKLDSRKVERFW